MTIAAIKPGDPPPFWTGLWHPEGKTEGAVMVNAGQQTAPVVEKPRTPPAETTQATPTQPAGESTQPEAPAQPKAALPKMWVLQLTAQAKLQCIRQAPGAGHPERATEFRRQAEQLLMQRQFPEALKYLQAAAQANPADASTIAMLSKTLHQLRSSADALHHALLATLLNPQEPQYLRHLLQLAWANGYVGWAIQMAQQLFKLAPNPEVAQIGKLSQSWLTTRTNARTAVCATCKAPALLEGEQGCPGCGTALQGAPANAQRLAGLIILQESEAGGRLYLGCTCIACLRETLVIPATGGAVCQHCQGPSLADIPRQG